MLILSAAIAEIGMGGSSPDGAGEGGAAAIVPDLVAVSALLCKQRKGVLRDKELLRQAHQGVVAFCREVLVRHGVIEPEKVVASKEDR